MTPPKPRPPRRITLDPSMIARATREQRAPVAAHVTARPPTPRGLIAYSLLGPTAPRREEA